MSRPSQTVHVDTWLARHLMHTRAACLRNDPSWEMSWSVTSAWGKQGVATFLSYCFFTPVSSQCSSTMPLPYDAVIAVFVSVLEMECALFERLCPSFCNVFFRIEFTASLHFCPTSSLNLLHATTSKCKVIDTNVEDRRMLRFLRSSRAFLASRCLMPFHWTTHRLAPYGPGPGLRHSIAAQALPLPNPYLVELFWQPNDLICNYNHCRVRRTSSSNTRPHFHAGEKHLSVDSTGLSSLVG